MALAGIGAGDTAEQQYAAAYEAAQHDGRPLLVLVCAESCAPCRVVKARDLPGLRRIGNLALVDADRDRTLVQRLRGEGPVPRLIEYQHDQARRQWRRRVVVGAEKIAAYVVEGLR
jgi:hypothetical protein